MRRVVGSRQWAIVTWVERSSSASNRWLWVKTNGTTFRGRCTTHFRTYFSGWIGMFTGGTIWLLTHGQVFFLLPWLATVASPAFRAATASTASWPHTRTRCLCMFFGCGASSLFYWLLPRHTAKTQKATSPAKTPTEAKRTSCLHAHATTRLNTLRAA